MPQLIRHDDVNHNRGKKHTASHPQKSVSVAQQGAIFIEFCGAEKKLQVSGHVSEDKSRRESKR